MHLTYALDHCATLRVDTDAARNYSLTFTGSVVEDGTLAVQATSTMALTFTSAALDCTGTVHTEPLDYAFSACPLTLAQDGNNLSGKLCGRTVGVGL